MSRSPSVLVFSILVLTILLAACVGSAPVATPIVIQETSGESTLTAAVRPTSTRSGPTSTPTATATPYTRPTDDPTLALNQPIARVGDEVITLGQFRQRVRYERFAALDNARRLIERVGIDKLNFATSGENPTADSVAAIFNTLSNSNAFGFQVYDIMVRESIIRQEFKARGLPFDTKSLRDYWVRYLEMQTVPDVDAVLPKARDDYIATATNYSGMPREAITQIFEAFVMSLDLRSVIGKERIGPLSVLQIKARHILARTQADADSAMAQLKKGDDFRLVACQYSIDPATRGNGGEIGYITRGQSLPGAKSVDDIFKASTGDIVGPMQSSLGWYVVRIKDLRTNADGDAEADVLAILVATESLANDLKARAQKGEDFGMLACMYSLDRNAGNGGDLGYIDPARLSDAAAEAIRTSSDYGLFGPFSAAQGFEIVLVEDRKLEMPKPGDISDAEAKAFAAWQTERASSNYVAALNDVWKKAIPADPLPRDVSPLMREENFGLPTVAPTGQPTAARQ
jgi:parvulin-like peptidyl-prolyl isomerase